MRIFPASDIHLDVMPVRCPGRMRPCVNPSVPPQDKQDKFCKDQETVNCQQDPEHGVGTGVFKCTEDRPCSDESANPLKVPGLVRI